MADFGRGRPSGDGDSLDAIARTDALLDALAGERRFTPGDPDELQLVSMLESWRDDIRGPSTAGVVTEQEALVALHKGKAGGPPGKSGHRRGLTLVTSLAAAVLCIGGFGAVVGTAGPGDSLYGLHTALFGEKPSVRDDQVALAAQTEMAQVQQLIEQGDWEQAQQKLQAVSTNVQSVENVETKTDLVQQFNDLAVKVGTRDAEATLPPVVPGEPAPPPPPGVTLLELPVVTTSTETTTSSETSTSTETTTSSETSTSTETTTPSETNPTETTSAPSGETSTTPTSEPASAAPTSAPSSTAAVASTTTAATTTVPTPTTTAPTPSTTVPTTTAPTTTHTTTTSAAPATTTTRAETTSAPAQAPAVATPPASSPSVPVTAPSTPQPQIAVTTTTTVPVPAAEEPN